MPQVTVQDVRIEDVVKGKNRYQIAHVVYTDNRGQQKEKKVLSFSNPAVFNTAKGLASGTVIEVSYAKDDPYFNWAKVEVMDADNPATGSESAAPKPTVGAASGKVLGNQYETRDERQMRQLHIVRQSSISNAINALTPGAKAPLKIEDVLDYAQELVDFVYGTEEILAAPNAVNEAVSET
jgi:hypothetical protein